MGYENNTFPLTSGTSYNQYGPRGTQDSAKLSGGQLHGAGGSEFDLVIYLTGAEFGGTATAVATSGVLPAGAKVISAMLEITETITMGNADNDISVGTSGSETTNGFDFDNTTGAIGVYDHDAINGTWANPLAAATTVAWDVAGTTPSMSGGKAKCVIRYIKV